MMKRIVPVCVLSAAVLTVVAGAVHRDGTVTFSDPVMDLGVVVSDLDAAIAFYTQVVGLQKTGGFTVGPEFCSAAGLTSGHALNITILTPNGDPQATQLKLMSVPEAGSRPADNRWVPSQLGFRYLTFFVDDLSAAQDRIRQHGAVLASSSPVPLGDGRSLILVRDPDGNLVEIIGRTSDRNGND